jgi:hypothetical protein
MAACAGETAAAVSDRRGDRKIASAVVGGSWEWRRAGHGSCGGGSKGKPGWRLGETMG